MHLTLLMLTHCYEKLKVWIVNRSWRYSPVAHGDGMGWRLHIDVTLFCGTGKQCKVAPSIMRQRSGCDADTRNSGVKGSSHKSGTWFSHTRLAGLSHRGRSGFRSAAARAPTSAPT